MNHESLINPQDLNFLLFDLLQSTELLERERYRDHSKETFSAAIDTAHKIARDYFAPHNSEADANEPVFNGQTVTTHPDVKKAIRAFADAGFLAATHDYEWGGMQLPVTISQSCLSLFRSANVGSSAYCFLTAANANLILSFGSESLRARYLPHLLSGKWLGTMALTEPQAGSSVPDLTSSATPLENGRYAIKGQKIFISGGDHDLSENIVHLVLARLPDAPVGAKGISLFIVPKYKVDENGTIQGSNDVQLAGLIHKMGYRGTTSTMLSFGENNACEGELIGEAGQGLRYMFQMMNEARVGVGMGGTMLGYRSYLESLQYAKERTQGRALGNKDFTSPPIPIIEHADVRRMLLTQKSYVEGALALCLYTARLVDDEKTHPDANAREVASLLIALLIPIVKSWPALYCLKANDLAIQIHGGYGYSREFIVEQLYRDNRLNAIHEGTHGIQALDLLNRKIPMKEGMPLQLLTHRVHDTIEQAQYSNNAQLKRLGNQLHEAWQELVTTARTLQAATEENPQKGSANAGYFLDLFGHHVIAWIWLEQANTAHKLINERPHQEDFLKGKIATAEWFYHTELALTTPTHQLLRQNQINSLDVPIEQL